MQRREQLVQQTQRENLSGIEFASWVEEVQCEDIVILLDFCCSGAFANALIQKHNLTVVSSTDYCHTGWYYWNWKSQLSRADGIVFGNSGSVFFHPFWKMINQSHSIEEAFNYGRAMCFHWGDIDENSISVTKNQNPQLFNPETSISEPEFGANMLDFLKSLSGPLVAGGISILIAWIVFRKERANYYKDRIFDLRGHLITNFRFMPRLPFFSDWEFLGHDVHLPREANQLVRLASLCSMSVPMIRQDLVGREDHVGEDVNRHPIPPEMRGGILLWTIGMLTITRPSVTINWVEGQPVYNPDLTSLSDEELLN